MFTTTASLTPEEASSESCMTPSGEILRKPRRPTPLLTMKSRTRIGTWNVRTLYEAWSRLHNENGERFSDFCAFNDLVIGGSIFTHKAIHKAIWISPDGRTFNQIDQITIARKWRTSLLDVRVKRGADIASDHHLLLGTLKMKLRTHQDSSARPHYKYNTFNLKCNETAKMFNCTVKNKFSALEFADEDLNNKLGVTWENLAGLGESCDEILGRRVSS